MGKRFTFLSLIMLLLLGRTMAQSVDITFNDGTVNSYKLKFTVIEGTNECSVKVSRPATELTALEIPTKVTIQNSDYYVTEIDSVAFRNCTKFSSVSLPDSLKMIRGRAFYNCSGLTGDLIIPDNVTYIGEYAFYGCYNIKGSLKLSEKLVTIGQYAFSRNSANNNNMGFSGSLVIPNNVKTIGHYAFNYCTNFRGSLNMSESLTSIGDYAFYHCEGFTGDLIIPKNVKSIGDYAFYYCRGFNGKLVLPNGLTSIGSYAFSSGVNYEKMNFTGDLVIPNSVTSIGSYAFYNAGFNGDLILSESITNINSYTFSYCSFKGNLRIPNSVTSIGSYAFYSCSSFDGDLSLPANLATIGSSAFYGCSKFNVMYCYALTPPSAQSNSFTGHNISILYVPEYSVDTYWETSPWNNEFFPLGLFKIEDYEVETKDENGNVLYSLIYSTTDDYSGVSVRIGQKPTTEVELVIPETLWYVEENFTYNVTTIPAEAFKDCSFFNGVEIPKYVNSIGENAFAGCSNIKIIKSLNPIPPSASGNSFKNTTARVAANSFDGIPATATLFVLPAYIDYYDIEPWNRFTIKPLLIDYEVFYYEGNSYYTLIYNLNEDYNSLRVKIGRISGSPKTLNIPESIHDINVTTIENKAFYYDGSPNTRVFETLVLSNTITHIGDSAFATYSSSYRFNLKGELIIPKSVTSIGNSAFYYCDKLTGLSFENGSALESIGERAFYYCSGLTGELIIPNSVTSIGNYAFYYCNKLTGLSFEAGSALESIGERAFYECSSLTGELIIPKSVTSIGNYAFYYCNKLTGLSFEENSNLQTIGNHAFSGYSDYNSTSMGFTGTLNIPKSVTSIGNYAFYYCNKLTGLSFEAGSALESIGGYAFSSCSSLTGELIIPKSVTSIGNYAFDNCNKLTGLSFEAGSALESIGGYAFYYCSSLTGELNIPKSVTSIGNYAFYSNKLTGLSFEAGSALESIGGYAFSSCSSLTGELIIPKSVTSIGNSAFYDNNLTGLSFEAGSVLESIGGYAFSYCYGLTGELIIPKSVTSIGDYAFYYCYSLTGELIIPKSVTSIGNEAFYCCNKLTGLSFEAGSALENIGERAFYECSSLTGELIIPNSVTSIGKYAFGICNKLTGLSFEAVSALESIGERAFSSCSRLTGELIIPKSVTSIGNSAFYACDFNRINCYSTTPASYSGSGYIFSSGTIYVPSISVELYKSVWNGDTSRINAYGFPTFISDGSIDDVNNWYVLEDSGRIYRLPNENEEIAINAALIINNNEILNVKSLGYCENGDLTVKEGGQLKCFKYYSDIKIEKNIEAHDTETTTWTTISSPLAADINPSNVTNLTSGNYDLYRYDEPSAVWQNYKNSANNGFITLEPGRGYIYSHSDNTTLTFNGKSKLSEVTYELTNESDMLPGFHLVGNPYTHNITMDNMMTATVETVLFEHLTIVLNDANGDGWDNDVAALQIVSDDGSINESFTLTSGSTATYELEISYKPITIKWKRGDYDSEDSFVITNELGETVLSYETGTLASVADGAILYQTGPTETPKDILVEGYYSLSNEGAWGAKLGDATVIKPCQGILVKTTEEGTLKINSSVDASKDRSGAKRKHNDILSISVANEKYEDMAYVSFNGGVGLDKIAHENERIPMVYIPCQDADYAIAIQDKDFEEIPVNFEAGSMGEYTISISQKECGFKQLYLYDKATDKIIDILRHDYTFFATTTEDPARFVLKPVCDVVLDEFAYINNGSLIIGNIVGNATINIYDVLGRSVLNSTCSDSEYDVSTERLASGVYIIHKSDDNGLKTQKVVIE